MQQSVAGEQAADAEEAVDDDWPIKHHYEGRYVKRLYRS